MEELLKWVETNFIPRILVVSSGSAKEALAKNNLSVPELFAPFSSVDQSFSFKTLGSMKTLNSIRVSFVDNLDSGPPRNIIEEYAPQCYWEGRYIASAADISSYLQSDPTVWYTKWQEDFLGRLSFSPHELIDMPLAVIYMASTMDENLVSTFRNLDKVHSLPLLYAKKIYDFEVPKIALLINDMKESNLNLHEIEGMFEEIQHAMSCSFYRFFSINSGPENSRNFWGVGKGQLLSNTDMHEIQTFVSELVPRVIIPFAVDLIKKLDTIIDNKRRGFRNSIKSIFKKSNERVEMFSFTVGTIEHVGRHIADLHFLFRDYANALTYYKSVSSDLKNARAFAHVGSALEMQAFCMLMLNAEFRDIEYALDSAYSQYQKSEDQYLLCRCAIYTKMIYSAYNQYKKLSEKLVATGLIVKSIPLVYGLFMEQTALCYLKTNPPKIRKYAFYEILAGNEYRENNLGQYGLNCYFSGSHIYNNKGWDHISLHLYNMLGRFCYFLNLNVEASHFFMKLVSCKMLLSSTDYYQKKVLNELLAPIARWTSQPQIITYSPITKTKIQFLPDKKPIFEFGLPQVKTYKVLLPQDKVFVMQEGVARIHSWSSLLPSNCTSLFKEFSLFDQEISKPKIRSLSAGEPIEIDVVTYNPLELLLIIDNIQIVAEYEEEGIHPDIEIIGTFEFKPKQEEILKLKVTPPGPGTLHLKGIQWTFGKAFHAFSPFKQETYKVLPHSTTLQVAASSYPTMLLFGEVQMVNFSFFDNSQGSYWDLKLITSHDDMFSQTEYDIPNGSSEFTIWMRGGLVGNHNIRFLFLYNTEGGVKSARAQLYLPVKHSVAIGSRVEHSMKDPNENILQLSISPGYQMKCVVNQISALSNHSLKMITHIEDEIFYLNIKEGTESQDIGVNGAIGEVREGFCWDLHKHIKEKKKSKEEGIDLLVSWEIHLNGNVHRGHNYLHNLDFFEQYRMLPIHMVVKAVPSVDHDFKEQIMLEVPVTVHVKNILPEAFTFILEALDSDVRVNSEDRTEIKEPFLYWSGVIRQVVDLSPGELKTFEFNAVFSSPGAYDVNRFSIALMDSPEKHLMPYEHWVIINSL